MELFKKLFYEKYTPTDADKMMLAIVKEYEVNARLSGVSDDYTALKILKKYVTSLCNGTTRQVINMDALAMLCYKKYYKDTFEETSLDFIKL